MSASDVQEKLDRAPRLKAMVPADWIETQSMLGRGYWHPLYNLLDASPLIWADVGDFVSALDAAIGAPVKGQVRTRAKRLFGSDLADYWSSLCELYFGAWLTTLGLEATLSGRPDLIARRGGSEIGIELTARQQTTDLDRLQERLTGVWRGPGAAVLDCDDNGIHFGPEIDAAVVQLFLAAAADLRRRPSTGEPAELDMTTSGAPSGLSARIEPRPVPYVFSQSSAAWGFTDPWPSIRKTVEAKQNQLTGQRCGVVAVELGHDTSDAHLWRIGLAYRTEPLVLEADPHIAGVLVYWQDIRRHGPADAIFVPNIASSGHEVTLLAEILAAAGLRLPGHEPGASN
jgi:hypothetical protein